MFCIGYYSKLVLCLLQRLFLSSYHRGTFYLYKEGAGVAVITNRAAMGRARLMVYPCFIFYFLVVFVSKDPNFHSAM